MNKAGLEAFSDGMIAILIMIMIDDKRLIQNFLKTFIPALMMKSWKNR